MAMHFIRSVQKIPASIEKVWDFYADPGNLQAITPDNMDFRIISGEYDRKLYTGQEFEYKVTPFMGIPLYWKTEITRVEAPYCFVDFQRKGPYAHWQHEHNFKSIEGGVEMTDSIQYKNPLWILGEFANTLFVKRRLQQIFEYRFKKVETIFGPWPAGQVPDITIG